MAKMDEEESSRVLEQYFRDFSGIKSYIENTKKSVTYQFNDDIPRNMGLSEYIVTWSESIGGRKRFFFIPPKGESNAEEITNRGIRSGIQRQAINARIQSTNANATKVAMTMLEEEFKKPEYFGSVFMRLVIHDEIVTSCPKNLARKVAEAQIRIMKEASQQFLKIVPSEVSCIISDTWTK